MKYLLFACILISQFATAQVVAKPKNIAEFGQNGHIITLAKNGEHYMIVFTDAQYQYISNSEVIEFNDKSGYIDFVNGLKAVDATHNFNGPDYYITQSPNMSSRIFVYKGEAMFFISRNHIKNWEKVIPTL